MHSPYADLLVLLSSSNALCQLSLLDKTCKRPCSECRYWQKHCLWQTSPLSFSMPARRLGIQSWETHQKMTFCASPQQHDHVLQALNCAEDAKSCCCAAACSPAQSADLLKDMWQHYLTFCPELPSYLSEMRNSNNTYGCATVYPLSIA